MTESDEELYFSNPLTQALIKQLAEDQKRQREIMLCVTFNLCGEMLKQYYGLKLKQQILKVRAEDLR
jgi:hypothetical protein